MENTTPKTDEKQKAIELLNKEKIARQEKCSNEIQESLKANDCVIDPTIILKANRATEIMINILAN